MLELTDPLWSKLDDALRDRVIPATLAELAAGWDHDTATSLFWNNLCHQETCYGATYASVPHLLTIAGLGANRRQRLEIALFLGQVVLCALERGRTPPLPGLPETADDWDRKLDGHRRFVAILEDPDRITSDYEQRKLLPHYRSVLAIEPISAAEIPKIQMIREDFLAAVPIIGALCEQALLEHPTDDDAAHYLLSGVAAANDLMDTARLLNCGSEGQLKCSACGSAYEYATFGTRIAIYAEPAAANQSSPDRAVLDYKEHEPSRCDGFVTPIELSNLRDNRALKLYSLAASASSSTSSNLLLHFLGGISCCKCGADAPIRAV